MKNDFFIFFSLIFIFSCKTISVSGCQDPVACNYNDIATVVGECIYTDGICDTCSGQRDGTGWIVDNDSNDEVIKMINAHKASAMGVSCIISQLSFNSGCWI